MKIPKILSIIVPVYNEETNIKPFYQALISVLKQTKSGNEIIFIDDGSTDGSYKTIGVLAQEDNRIKCLRFSRNFGSHAALLAGLQWASGDAVVIISADLPSWR